MAGRAVGAALAVNGGSSANVMKRAFSTGSTSQASAVWFLPTAVAGSHTLNWIAAPNIVSIAMVAFPVLSLDNAWLHAFQNPLSRCGAFPAFVTSQIAQCQEVEQTFIMIKPDGFQRGLVSTCLYWMFQVLLRRKEVFCLSCNVDQIALS